MGLVSPHAPLLDTPLFSVYCHPVRHTQTPLSWTVTGDSGHCCASGANLGLTLTDPAASTTNSLPACILSRYSDFPQQSKVNHVRLFGDSKFTNSSMNGWMSLLCWAWDGLASVKWVCCVPWCPSDWSRECQDVCKSILIQSMMMGGRRIFFFFFAKVECRELFAFHLMWLPSGELLKQLSQPEFDLPPEIWRLNIFSHSLPEREKGVGVLRWRTILQSNVQKADIQHRVDKQKHYSCLVELMME